MANIFIDARTLLTSRLTGVPIYTKYIIEELLKKDTENNYILFSNAFKKNISLANRFGFRGPRVREVNWGIPNRPFNFFSAWLDAPRIPLKELDLVFSPHIHPISPPKGVPRVITIHDLAFARFPKFFSAKERLWHALPRPREQARRADHIIAVSETTKRDLMEFWKIPEEKISVVYLGRHEVLPPEKEENSLRIQALNFPFVLFLGTWEPRKNIEGLIAGFEVLKENSTYRDMRLLVAGGRGWKYAPIFARVRRSKAREHILFFDFPSDGELQVLYKKASLFAYASFFEGFVFPPLQAQSLGCPVVVSGDGVFQETLSGSARLVNQYDPHALAEGMHDVLSSPALREELIQKGFENAKRFSWEKTAEGTLAVFSKFFHRLQ
jgi:glycosyltransferase involved in cell wall biosynthesis